MLFLWRIYQVQQASETSVHNQIGDSDDNAVCDIKNVVSDKISHLCRQRSPLAPRAPFIPILFLVFLAFLWRHALIAYVQLAFPFCSFRKSHNWWWIDFIFVWQRPLLIPILMKHLPNLLCFWLGFHLPQIQIEFVANMIADHIIDAQHTFLLKVLACNPVYASDFHSGHEQKRIWMGKSSTAHLSTFLLYNYNDGLQQACLTLVWLKRCSLTKKSL